MLGRSTGCPASSDQASRTNWACDQASGVADSVPSPTGNPGLPPGGKSAPQTCSGSRYPSLAAEAIWPRRVRALRGVAQRELVLAALAAEDRPVAADRGVVGPVLGRVRGQADVPRAAVLALAVAVEGEAVPERAAIGAPGGEHLVDDGDRVAHGRVVGAARPRGGRARGSSDRRPCAGRRRRAAVADVVGRALVRLAVLRQPQVVRLAARTGPLCVAVQLSMRFCQSSAVRS